MADGKTQATGTGIGFVGLLTIALIVMKTTHTGDVANWPWWLVLFGPLLGTLAFSIGCLIVFGIGFLAVMGIKLLVKNGKENRKIRDLKRKVDAGTATPKEMIMYRLLKTKKEFDANQEKTKSKWQQRIEELQKQQRKARENDNGGDYNFG